MNSSTKLFTAFAFSVFVAISPARAADMYTQTQIELIQPDFGPYFSDAKETEFWPYVRTLAIRGIIDFQANFRVTEAASRAEVAKILIKSLSQSNKLSNYLAANGSGVPCGFNDVDALDKEVIDKAVQAKLISCLPSFRPSDPVSRQEFAKMAYQAAVISEVISSSIPGTFTFSDDSKIDPTLKPYAYGLYEKHILSGYADGSFGPLNNVTRGQVSKIVANVFFPLESDIAFSQSEPGNLVLGDTSTKVYKLPTFIDPVANDTFDSFANILNNKFAAKYGSIDWTVLSDDELRIFVQKINKYNYLPGDTVQMQVINSLQQKRNTAFANSSQALHVQLEDDGSLLNLFLVDPAASFDFGIEVSSILLEAAIDGVELVTPFPHVGRPTNMERNMKKLGDALEIFATVPGLIKCANTMNSISKSFGAKEIGAVVGDCGAFALDTLKDFGNFTKGGQLKLTYSSAVAKFVGDGVDVVTEEEKRIQTAKAIVMTVGLVKDLASAYSEGNEPLKKTVAAVDLALQICNSAIAGAEFNMATSKKVQSKIDETFKRYDKAVSEIWRVHNRSFLGVLGSYYFGIQGQNTRVLTTITTVGTF
jgi:hypothetical protein